MCSFATDMQTIDFLLYKVLALIFSHKWILSHSDRQVIRSIFLKQLDDYDSNQAHTV